MGRILRLLIVVALIVSGTGLRHAQATPGSFPLTIDDAAKAKLVAAGVSPRAIDLLLNEMNRTHYISGVAAIVDYTIPADKPRLFVINLDDGSFQSYHVSHGTKSGGDVADSFSNELGSNKSSLGFIRTGKPYMGRFGREVPLIGVSKSNSNDQKRAILLHSAEYSSEDFLKKNGFWGRSFGCLAVPQKDIDEIIFSLGNDGLILAYQDRLWDQAQKTPESQTLPGAPPAPPATEWETVENNKGDPHPHHEGDPPTSYYKQKYGDEDLAASVQGISTSLKSVPQAKELVGKLPHDCPP
jgi:hypothetical protein